MLGSCLGDIAEHVSGALADRRVCICDPRVPFSVFVAELAPGLVFCHIGSEPEYDFHVGDAVDVEGEDFFGH